MAVLGFLRTKTVGKYTYLYWCERRRSHKRSGGSGRVKSLDFSLGTRIGDGHLDFFLWVGDIPRDAFFDAALAQVLAKFLPFMAYTYRLGSAPKIFLRGKDGVDLRRKYCRDFVDRAKAEFLTLHSIVYDGAIQKNLAAAAEWLEYEREWLEYAKSDGETWERYESDTKAGRTEWFGNDRTGQRIYLADCSDSDIGFYCRSREWTEYSYNDDYCGDLPSKIDEAMAEAAAAREMAMKCVDAIVESAPKGRRDEARKKAVGLLNF